MEDGRCRCSSVNFVIVQTEIIDQQSFSWHRSHGGIRSLDYALIKR